MKHLSDLGAAKGGKARAERLTPERRREIARKAVEARWARERERKREEEGETREGEGPSGD
jgi:hypothetical protein